MCCSVTEQSGNVSGCCAQVGIDGVNGCADQSGGVNSIPTIADRTQVLCVVSGCCNMYITLPAVGGVVVSPGGVVCATCIQSSTIQQHGCADVVGHCDVFVIGCNDITVDGCGVAQNCQVTSNNGIALNINAAAGDVIAG